jgi:hypothetical protein
MQLFIKIAAKENKTKIKSKQHFSLIDYQVQRQKII